MTTPRVPGRGIKTYLIPLPPLEGQNNTGMLGLQEDMHHQGLDTYVYVICLMHLQRPCPLISDSTAEVLSAGQPHKLFANKYIKTGLLQTTTETQAISYTPHVLKGLINLDRKKKN